MNRYQKIHFIIFSALLHLLGKPKKYKLVYSLLFSFLSVDETQVLELQEKA